MPPPPTAPSAPVRVSPYSVIDITAFQEDPARNPDPEAEGDGVSLHVPSGYVVPVPCGYAVPCSLPALLPAYSSPVVVCAPAPPEDGRPLGQHPAPCSVSPLLREPPSPWGRPVQLGSVPRTQGARSAVPLTRRLPSGAWHVVLGEALGVQGP